MQTSGRKEVVEAVIIAALTTAVASLVQWGVSSLQTKAETTKRKKKKRKE